MSEHFVFRKVIVMDLLFFVFFIFLSCTFYLLIKGAGSFSSTSIILFTTLPYVVAPIIDIYFFNNSNNFSINNVATLTFYCLLFYLSFVIFSLFPLGTSKTFSTTWRLHSRVGPHVYFVGLIILLLLYVQLSISLSHQGTGNRASLYQEKSLSFDLIKLFLSAAIICFALLYMYANKIYYKLYLFISLSTFLVSESFLLGDRRVWITTFLACAFILLRQKRKISWKILSALGVSLIFFLGIGVLRGGGQELSDYLRVLNISNMEFGTFAKIYDYCASYSCDFNSGSYSHIPAQLIPGMFGLDRPMPPSSLFAMNFDYQYYSSGGTYAYNFILESVQNFGPAGPFLIGAFISSIFNLQSRIKSDLRLVTGVILIFSFGFFFRMEFLSVIKIGLIFSAMLISILLLFGKLSRQVI